MKQCMAIVRHPPHKRTGRPEQFKRCRRWVPGGVAYCCKHNETKNEGQ